MAQFAGSGGRREILDAPAIVEIPAILDAPEISDAPGDGDDQADLVDLPERSALGVDWSDPRKVRQLVRTLTGDLEVLMRAAITD